MNSPYKPLAMLVYSDSEILVINKPAGLLSLQDGYDKTLPHMITVLEPEFGRLLMVHRLDRETSGLVVVARTVGAHRQLNIQFQKREVSKIYHALVQGSPPWDRISINYPLRRDGDRQHRTVIDMQRGKKASTEFFVLERFKEFSLIEARPKTGYTHQIRAHIARIGFPVVSDRLYNKTGKNSSSQSEMDSDTYQNIIDRLALHASSISFIHPSSGQKVSFSAPYPEDFQQALDFQRNKSS